MSMALYPHPLGSLRLLGVDDRRLDAGLSAVVVVLVVASHLAAFPCSIRA